MTCDVMRFGHRKSKDMPYHKTKTYMLAITSGFLAALAYSYTDLGFLIFFAFIPFFLALIEVQPQSGGFGVGFVAGLTYFLYSFHWFLSLQPLDGLGISNHFLSLVLVLAVWLFVASILAIFWGLFGLLIVKLKHRLANRSVILEILVVPALFVLLEYLRAYVFSFVTFGSGGLLGPHWTFGNFAYALAGNSLFLGLASFVGIYGVLFIIVLINVSVFKLIAHKKIKHLMVIILFTVTLIIIGQIWERQVEGARTLNFSIIQTDQRHSLDDNSENGLNSFKKQFELLDRVIKESPESQVIIFPEGSNFFKNLSSFLTPAQIKKYFTDLAKDPKLIIDNSRVAVSQQTAYSRVLFLNSRQDIIGFYDKKILTPGGEYLPVFVKLVTSLVAPKNKASFESLVAFSTGQDQKLASFNNTNFRAAACSDFLSPGLLRSQTQDTDVIIGLASTAIFHGSRALINQNLTINKFRAAENNTPIISAANTGLSYALDNRGNTIKIASDSSPQLLTGTVVIGAEKSWYNKVGDWPILLASLLLLGYSVQVTGYSKKKRRNPRP